MTSPEKNRASSYYARWLVLGLSLLALFIVIAVELYLERGGVVTRERDRLLAQTRVIAENMETRLASANLALADIRAQYLSQHRSGLTPELASHLGMLLRVMPGIRTINILDARGKLVASNRTDLIGTDLAFRDYFKRARAHPDPDMLYVSPPFETLLGIYAINLSRAIVGPQGEFRGLLTATLDPDYFRSLMSSVLYAPDMWDAVAHGDGTLFLMQPERERLRGMNLALPGSFFTQHRESGKNASVQSGKVYSTGEFRIMAQRTVKPSELKMDQPLVVGVSRDLDALYRPWRRQALFEFALFAVIAGLSILGMYGYQRHRSRLERQASQARELVERFGVALDHMPTYIYMKDRQRRYVYANKPTLELFGCTAEELAGSPDSRFFPPEAVARLHEIDSRVLERGKDTAEEVMVAMPDGKRRVYWEIKTPIYEGGDRTRIWGLCGISTDITERKVLEERFEKQAHLDYLTGLNNRRHFMELGEVELARAQRHGRDLSVFMLDIDHFKQFNDAYGHKAGDLVLLRLAEVMGSALRAEDVIGRIGGEEFAVFLPETPLAKAGEIAERLRASVAQAAVVFDAGQPQYFTVSIGFTALRGLQTNLDILLGEADRALYEAKAAGRNRVVSARGGDGAA